MINKLTQISRHFNAPIASFRCDNENEFLTTIIVAISRRLAIVLDLTCLLIPQENGTAERLNRKLCHEYELRWQLSICRLTSIELGSH